MMTNGPGCRVVILKIRGDLIPGRNNVHPKKTYGENDYGRSNKGRLHRISRMTIFSPSPHVRVSARLTEKPSI